MYRDPHNSSVTCVTISGVADGATLIECNYPHKYSVRKSACTHINVHTLRTWAQVLQRSWHPNSKWQWHTELLKRFTEPEKQVHNNSYRPKHPVCVCVYIYVCDCASVLTQCVNVFVIQPSQRKLSSILSPSLTLCLLATRHLRPKNKPSEMNRTKK